MTHSNPSPETRDERQPIVPNSKDAWHLVCHAQSRLAAEALRERYSSIAFHAERARSDPRYWIDYGSTCPNLMPNRFIREAEAKKASGDNRTLPEILDELRATKVDQMVSEVLSKASNVEQAKALLSAPLPSE